MRKVLLTGKRVVVAIVLVVYLGGVCHEFIIQSSHLFYHFITETLHQHHSREHLHDHHHDHSHTHEHGHEHIHLIDQALEIDNKSEGKNQPETPVNNVEVKFTDHLLKLKFTEGISYKQLQQIFTPYSFTVIEGFKQPIIPPPKFS